MFFSGPVLRGGVAAIWLHLNHNGGSGGDKEPPEEPAASGNETGEEAVENEP